MSKLLYCPNCKKDVPTGKVPDATVVHEYLSAPLDCNGAPIFDNSKLDKAWKNQASAVCYWCGGALTERPKPQPQLEPKPQPKPEAKPQSKPEPKPHPKPEPKPQPKPEPKKEVRNERKQVEEKGPDIPKHGIDMIFNSDTQTLWIVGNGSLETFIKENKDKYKSLVKLPVRRMVFRGSIKDIWPKSSKFKGLFSSVKFSPSDFTGLREVVLPEGLTAISNGGFAGCSNLEKITLPNSLREIDPGSFIGSESSLREIVNLHPRVEYHKFTFESHTLLKGKIPPSQ